jgi:hypothetical protein
VAARLGPGSERVRLRAHRQCHFDDVIISPAISDEDAKEKFPRGFTTLKPYLRLTPQPGR